MVVRTPRTRRRGPRASAARLRAETEQSRAPSRAQAARPTADADPGFSTVATERPRRASARLPLPASPKTSTRRLRACVCF
eukprot:10175-Chlamydomonas_euryale.AAC.12